jgi:hypothetical protein
LPQYDQCVALFIEGKKINKAMTGSLEVDPQAVDLSDRHHDIGLQVNTPPGLNVVVKTPAGFFKLMRTCASLAAMQ